MYCGKKKDVVQCKDKLMNKLDREDMGKLEECLGCKIERKDTRIKLTQPVLVHILKDEFVIPPRTQCTIPEPANKELVTEGEPLSE